MQRLWIVDVALAALLVAGVARADDFEILRAECAKQLKFSSSGCQCIVDAASGLSEAERKVVVAHVVRDRKAIAETEKALSAESVRKALDFFSQVPNQCASK